MVAGTIGLGRSTVGIKAEGYMGASSCVKCSGLKKYGLYNV